MLLIEVGTQFFSTCFTSVLVFHIDIDMFVNCNWVDTRWQCTVHIYIQTVHRTTQLTTLVGRLSGIRTQNGQTKINDELNA